MINNRCHLCNNDVDFGSGVPNICNRCMDNMNDPKGIKRNARAVEDLTVQVKELTIKLEKIKEN